MTSFEKLLAAVKTTNSILCVGLDSSVDKLPSVFKKDIDSLLLFNQRLIEATAESTAAYKINFAFYEQYGSAGFDILQRTVKHIPKDKLIIADAKRGDIGNTSTAYAKSVFDYFGCDAITVNPYMGFDSVGPFLEYKDKFVFLLALTSNKGSSDFQYIESEGVPLYRHVIEKSTGWGGANNLGFVFGATHPTEIESIRSSIPDRALLIPGVGTQGGDIAATIKANGNGPALINVSRDIIYSNLDDNYAKAAEQKAKFYKNEFNKYR